MDTRSIAFAIPFFFLLIGIEHWLDGLRRKRLSRETEHRLSADDSSRPTDPRTMEPAYRFADTITSLSCGVGQQVLAITVVSVLAIGGYTWVYEHGAIFHVPLSSVPGWIAIMLLVDLAYYAYHRASHRINFFWATHVVHHQSEEYNLGTALRQSWFTGLTSWIFYLPIALLGFPPLMYVIGLTFNTLYQFWIHTRRIGKLGAFEKLFNTPSHHRVHHGIDPEYIDKNYAGVFIVWDMLFGTFIEEGIEPAYGTVKPLASFNPLWANVEGFAALFQMSRKTNRFRDKLLVWVAPPEWRPADLGGPVTVPHVDHATRERYETREAPGVRRYVVAQFVVTSLVVGGLLFFNQVATDQIRNTGVVMTLGSLMVWGGLFERRAWAKPLEVARLLFQVWFIRVVVLVGHYSENFELGAQAMALTLSLASMVWVLTLEVGRPPLEKRDAERAPSPDRAAGIR